jgi:hypothetical protein
MTYYIATRASFADMESALGHRVARLNQKMSATLRQAAMTLDIKQKTKDGGRLEFYSVSDSDYARLTDPEEKFMMLLGGSDGVRPLASLVESDLNKAITDINGRYTGRMDYSTHQKYLKELKQATGALLTKLDQDVKPVRELKPKLAANPYQVGDLFSADWEHSAPTEFKNYADCRVARVSKAYVWLERICFKDTAGVSGNWSNTDSAKRAFKNVKSYGSSSQWENHGHFIPLADNSHVLEWRALKDYKGQLVRQRWDKVASYCVKPLGQSGEVGYCYSTEPNYN